jgi:hypothetical protein
MRVFNMVMDWLLAVVTATLVTCWTHTWRVQTHLIELGVVIPTPLKMQGVMKDAFGMGPAVGAVYGVALALAFGIAVLGLRALARRKVPLGPYFAFPLAGATAIGLTLFLMKLSYDITPLAGARDRISVVFSVWGGALAGVVFAWFRPKAPLVLP